MNPSELTQVKSLLRNKLRQSLKKIADSKRKKKSAKIVRKLIQSSFFKEAESILTYVALPGEVQTQGLIQEALEMKKNVFVPRISLKNKKIEIYQIKNGYRDLHRGNYGILEPKPLKTRKGNIRKMDLIIVPGIGFARSGARLGRGGGYFDRFLAKSRHAQKIGLAFREQIVKEIPVGAKDIPMDCVITD